MDIVRASTELRDEQRQIVQFAVVPDLDMAGARGSALAALQMLGEPGSEMNDDCEPVRIA
jgi:glucokinase